MKKIDDATADFPPPLEATSSQLLHQLFENAHDGIFLADRLGRYIEVNPAGCRLLGYRREELIGRSVTELIPPEDLPRQAELTRMLQAGAREVSEWRLRRKDGSLVPVELSASAFPDGTLQSIVRDISERREAEAALRRSEAKFSGIVAISADAIVSADERQRIVIFNEGAEKIFGYSSAEVMGAPLDLLLPEALRHGHQEAVKRFGAGGEPSRRMGERRAIIGRRKNGEEFPAEAAISKLDLEGRPLFTVSLRDVSEARRAEAALRASVTRFEAAVRGARATVVEEGPELQPIWSYGGDPVPGFEAGLAERTRAAKLRVLQTGEPAREVVSVGTHWYDTTLEPLRDPAGRITGVITAFWDISEQKRVEERERLLAEAGRVLVAAGADQTALLDEIAGVIIRNLADWCAVDVVQDGRLRRLRVRHADPERAAVCDELERFPVHARSNAVAAVVASQKPLLVNDVSPAFLQANARSPDRLLRALDPTALIIAPLVARGQSLGTLTFGATGGSRRYDERDVEMAEQLAARVALAVDNARLHENLERAVQARDEVLSVVAHDLRGPLSSIDLVAQVLGQQSPLSAHDEIKRVVASVRRSVRRANRLIEDLLDVTRIDARQLFIERSHFAVAELIQEAVEGELAAATAASLRIAAAPAPELRELWADRDRCLQVLENLIGNALKFTPAGGAITVGASALGDEVELWVADSGPGIPAENQTHVFERYWQAHRSDRRGAGLGLRICKGIVEAQGGQIRVESTPGHGATFRFTVPTWDGREAAPREEPAARRPKTILVVDDEPAALTALGQLLQEVGYRVLLAGRPSEAMKLLSDNSVDLLLTDVRLPEMGGEELATRSRAVNPLLRVIFMSGVADVPMGAFVPKPIDFDALLRAIDGELLRG